jgi:membrane-bound ClpP family serine protease
MSAQSQFQQAKEDIHPHRTSGVILMVVGVLLFLLGTHNPGGGIGALIGVVLLIVGVILFFQTRAPTSFQPLPAPSVPPGVLDPRLPPPPPPSA